MDNLTHSLIGAALGQAGLKGKTGLAMPALIVGANVPDIDVLCFLWLDGVEHVGFRRGITHGPIAMVLLPLLVAWGLWGFDKWQAQRGTRPEARLPVRFGWLLALSFIACLTHPLFDWFNNYGVRLLEPFSSQWFYGDTLFIIDPWIIAMLGAGVWWSLRREKGGRVEWTRPAHAGLIALLAYVVLNLGISARHKAEFASSMIYGGQFIASPVPMKFWERQHIIGKPKEAWHTVEITWNGRKNSEIVQIPMQRCAWPTTASQSISRQDIEAFLFWSRAPYAERSAAGNHVVIGDARFSSYGVRNRFTVDLRDTPCIQPPSH